MKNNLFVGIRNIGLGIYIDYALRIDHHDSEPKCITIKIRPQLKHFDNELACGFFQKNLSGGEINDKNKVDFVEESIAKFEKENAVNINLAKKAFSPNASEVIQQMMIKINELEDIVDRYSSEVIDLRHQISELEERVENHCENY